MSENSSNSTTNIDKRVKQRTDTKDIKIIFFGIEKKYVIQINSQEHEVFLKFYRQTIDKKEKNKVIRLFFHQVNSLLLRLFCCLNKVKIMFQ